MKNRNCCATMRTKGESTVKKHIWLPLLVLLFSLLCSAVLHIQKQAEYESWVSTNAQVEAVDHSTRKKASKRYYTISYTYEAEGTTYYGSNTYSGSNSSFSAGDHTEIWYDPAEPQTSSFHQPNPLSNSLVPLTLGVGAAFVLYRKLKR